MVTELRQSGYRKSETVSERESKGWADHLERNVSLYICLLVVITTQEESQLRTRYGRSDPDEAAQPGFSIRLAMKKKTHKGIEKRAGDRVWRSEKKKKRNRNEHDEVSM